MSFYSVTETTHAHLPTGSRGAKTADFPIRETSSVHLEVVKIVAYVSPFDPDQLCISLCEKSPVVFVDPLTLLMNIR